MDDILNKLKNVQQDGCVTIIMNTHRTSPDNKRDPIQLKNSISEAEERLDKDFDKRKAAQIKENLNKAASSINHSYNLESLMLFASEDHSEFVRLPVEVEDRVILDQNFATRDLIRAIHQNERYLVLVISRRNARLIRAFNDKVEQEVNNDDFPFENTNHYSTDKHQLSMAKGTDHQYEEFFNRADKMLNAIEELHGLPVLIVTEERNLHHYKKVADRPERIIGHLNKNRDDEKVADIVAEAWTVVRKVIAERNEQRIGELKKAVSSGNFLSDYNDIWRAVNDGRARTLFIKKGLFQPARINGNDIELKPADEASSKDVVDDIVDEMIERNLNKGGENVFLESDELKEFNGLALLTRY